MKLRILVMVSFLLAGCGLRPQVAQVKAPPVQEARSAWEEFPAGGRGTAVTKHAPEQPSAGVVEVGRTVPSRVRVTPVPVVSMPPERRASRSNIPLELPGSTDVRGVQDPELSSLLSTAEYSNMATDWRRAAERAVAVEAFAHASRAFRNEAEIYRGSGDIQAAIAEETKASYYTTELQLYRTVPAPEAPKLERLEPASGCYVGAFIDRDDTLHKLHMESQIHGDIPQFNKLVEKPHASFFMYRSYGKEFPKKWARYVKEQGAIPHISWEPKSLEDVRDDDYLRRFMSEAAKLDHPVILRFAGEMNGEWTPYHGDPQAYIEAFRTVYRASRKAPKVAMLWCPNAVPQSSIEDYYPGDDYVDWIGVNFYSVPYLDNDINRPGDKIFPADQLKFVYEKYAARKPIAVGEWAASQRSSLRDRNLTSFATTKLAQLYSVLPTQYPRVKMVNWYSCNNIERAKEERQLNNFQVTNNEDILDAYRRAVGHPHFLGADSTDSSLALEVAEGQVKMSEGDEIRLALKSYDSVLKVYFMTGGKVIHASDDPLEWFVTAEQLVVGGGELKVLVFDSKDRFVTRGDLEYLRG